MTPICVIGIGSPFGTDQLGWLVIDWLRTHSETTVASEITYLSLDRPATRLLEYLSSYEKVILIDAIADSTEQGKIIRIDKDDLMCDESRLSSHAMGVSEVLRLAEVLGVLPDDVTIFGANLDPNNPMPPDMHIIKSLAQTVINECHVEIATV